MKKSSKRNSKETATSAATLRAKARPLLTCPDTGNNYRVRLPDIADVISTGVLPENFTAKTLEALGNVSNGELTDRDLLNNEAIKQATVTATLIELRIVEKPESDDEVSYKDIPPEDREYIYKWATRRLPNALVGTGGGETSVAALENFSAKGRSSESSGFSSDRADAESVNLATAEA